MPSLNTQLPNLNKAWFKSKRIEKGHTVRSLAKVMGLNPSTVSLMLRGIRDIHHDDAQQLATIFGVSLVEIYRHAGKPMNDPSITERFDLAEDIATMTQELLKLVEAGEPINPKSLLIRNLKRATDAYLTSPLK